MTQVTEIELSRYVRVNLDNDFILGVHDEEIILDGHEEEIIINGGEAEDFKDIIFDGGHAENVEEELKIKND
jgi:hypothetical protein